MPGPRPRQSSTSALGKDACLMCRKRKVKCDNSRPFCKNCTRRGDGCEYSSGKIFSTFVVLNRESFTCQSNSGQGTHTIQVPEGPNTIILGPSPLSGPPVLIQPIITVGDQNKTPNDKAMKLTEKDLRDDLNVSKSSLVQTKTTARDPKLVDSEGEGQPLPSSSTSHSTTIKIERISDESIAAGLRQGQEKTKLNNKYWENFREVVWPRLVPTVGGEPIRWNINLEQVAKDFSPVCRKELYGTTPLLITNCG